jgi:hypothetical protein
MPEPSPNLYTAPRPALEPDRRPAADCPPAGDLDAALRGEVRLRAFGALGEGWRAAPGHRLPFLGALLAWGLISVVPQLLVAWAWLASRGLGLDTLLSAPEVWPTVMGAAPSWARALLVLSGVLTGALGHGWAWALGLRHLGGGVGGSSAAVGPHRLPRLVVVQLVGALPALVALAPVPEAAAPALGWAMTATSAALSFALVWAPPLIIDRDMGAVKAVGTSARLLPRTALPVLVLGVVALMGGLLAVLSCGLALVWLAPWCSLTLGAAWRQLAGMQRTWGY